MIEAMPNTDLRRFQRVKVSILGRFMRPDQREYPCQVIDMSPGGALLIAPVQVNLGERIVAYLDELGRVEGHVVRITDTGFAMTIQGTATKRDKLAVQLTWIANRDVLHLEDERAHERRQPKNPIQKLVTADGTTYTVRVVDVSMSGARIATEDRPPVGTSLMLGRLRAMVVRHTDDGIGVTFAHTSGEHDQI